VKLLQHSFVLAIRAYRLTLSPAQLYLCGPAAGCRFAPTCSAYAQAAITTHGALAGGWLAVKRLGRCHPWGGCGHDPVPPKPLHQPDPALQGILINFHG
jgi:putative membrane protein insertion efficiency factor